MSSVGHRDYTSNASVQMMLFKDRLEIWHPKFLRAGRAAAAGKSWRTPMTSVGQREIHT